jgi:hypothetical protein
VSGLADRDHEDSCVGVEIVKIVAHAQDATLAMHVTRESFGDGSLFESVPENFAGGVTHGVGEHAAEQGNRRRG